MQPSPNAEPLRVGRVHRLNIGVNLVLAGGKLALGFAAGSGALVADGLNSASDLFSNAVAWVGYRLSLRPPDEDHHYGHGNFEAAAATLIGGVILSAGLAVLWRAFTEATVTEVGGLGWAALVAAAASVLACFWLSSVTLRVGREVHSPSLVALGRDKRSDALSSLLAVIAIGGSLAGVAWIEPPVTMLVGGWIAVLGFKSIVEGLDVLMDRVTDPGLRGELEAVARAVPGVEEVHDVRIHPLGSSYGTDLTLWVNGALTVTEGHEIAVAAEAAIRRSLERIDHVVVHVEPAGAPAHPPG